MAPPRPRYSVIVPMRLYWPAEPVLAGLRAAGPPPGTVEVLVAEGHHPARQRNAALERARGDIVVFLDNDCTPGEAYWDRLEADFARPEVAIVGGPALLAPGAGRRETVFHALLSHPLLVGAISARYAARGAFRPATQAELILCNLAVRRSLFERIGPLSAQLYPNEENEWLDRAQAAGAGLAYDPELRVFRPQRGGLAAFCWMLMRYGIGRTRQAQVSRRPSLHLGLPPFLLLLRAAGAADGHAAAGLALLWLLLALVIGPTCPTPLRPEERVAAGLIAPLVPLAYAAGQILGWLPFLRHRDLSPVVLRDAEGIRLDA